MSIHKIAAGPWGCPDFDALSIFLGAGDDTNTGGRNRYPYTYVIYTDGDYFYAENGTTGELDYGGPSGEGGAPGGDADAVIQAAVNAASGGGVFKIKAGTYPLSAAINYYSNQQFVGDGMAFTIFTVSSDISAFAPPDTTTNRNYALFRDFSIQLIDTDTTGPALDLTRFNYSRVIRVSIWSNDAANLWGEGIRVRTVAAGGMAYYNFIEGVNVGRFNDYGIHFLGIAGDRVNLNWVKRSRVGSGSGAAAVSILYDFADYGHVENCNVGGAAVGIRVDNADVTEIDRLFFEGTTTTCIDITANANDTMLRRNFLGVVGPVDVADLGTNTYYDHNFNYVTRNYGTATIVAAGTSIAAAHGCDYTPNASDIRAFLTNQPTNDIGDVWFSAIGAANFTINCRNVPGAATAIFAWSVDRNP